MALSERFEMRFDQDTLASIDAWRHRIGGMPSRAEAVRRLVEIGLASERSAPVKISDGEKLSLMLLCEIAEKLKIGGDTDTKFVKEAILGGHNWAFKWQMTGLFHDYTASEEVAREVGEILAMWSALEHAHKALSAKDRERIEKEAQPFGKTVKFPGFDGNNESGHYSVARFMIDDMGRFAEFTKRDLNSHMPLLGSYRRMLVPFNRIWLSLTGGKMSVGQIIEVLKARQYQE